MFNNNDIVVKSNKLIQARYSLNLNEQKIILCAVSKINREQEDFNIIEMKVQEFTELIESSSKRYTEIRELVRELRKKELIIKDDKTEREIITGWLSSIEYKDDGVIELEFSKKLMPYLLQLRKQFTKYELQNVLFLKSKYSIRIYELLKQYEKLKQRVFTIKELKLTIGCENKYKEFKNFKRFILEKVKEEINYYTDLKIEYECIKTGRKVTSIKFYIHSNKEYNDNELSATLETTQMKGQLDVKNYELIDQINQIKKKIFNNKIKLSDNDIHTLLKVADNDINKIKKAFKILDDYRKTHNVRSAMAFLISCITRNWPKGQSLKQTKPASGFINFKQRDDKDYDWEEIERLEREQLERELENQAKKSTVN